MSDREYVVEGPSQMEPAHPGAILAEALDAEKVSVVDAAKALGVTRQTLHRVLAKQAGITPDMAIRLGEFIGNGPGLWLRMQVAYDLWHAERSPKKKSMKVVPIGEASKGRTATRRTGRAPAPMKIAAKRAARGVKVRA